METRDQALERIHRLIGHYPAGLVVEEYIGGRELSVPFLESFPGNYWILLNTPLISVKSEGNTIFTIMT